VPTLGVVTSLYSPGKQPPTGSSVAPVQVHAWPTAQPAPWPVAPKRSVSGSSPTVHWGRHHDGPPRPRRLQVSPVPHSKPAALQPRRVQKPSGTSSPVRH